MRFTHAWADVIAQNLTLKVVVTALSITTVTLGLTSVKLALKKPLVIERSCYSKAANLGSTEHSPLEIETFVFAALSQRFDTNAVVTGGYLSIEEELSRRQEQRDLVNKGMNQTVIINSVKIDGQKVFVDSDRLIAIGQIRSALPLPLLVNLSTTDRTEGNPYGLLIEKVSIVKKEDKK